MARKVNNQALAEIIQTASEQFRQLAENEDDTLFGQCSWLAETSQSILAEFPDIDAALVKKELIKECGIKSRKGSSSMRDRWIVGHIFNGKYARSHDYSLHVVCARAEGVNVDDPATYAIAEKWLQTAEAGYTETKRGKEHWRPHSTRTLKALMKAGKVAKDKPEVWLKNVPCTIHKGEIRNGSWFLALQMDESESFPLRLDTLYELTLISKPAQTPVETEQVEPLENTA